MTTITKQPEYIFSGCEFIRLRPHYHVWSEHFQGYVCEYSGLVHRKVKEVSDEQLQQSKIPRKDLPRAIMTKRSQQ